MNALATFSRQHAWLEADARKHRAVGCPSTKAAQLAWHLRSFELKCRVAQLKREYHKWFNERFGSPETPDPIPKTPNG